MLWCSVKAATQFQVMVRMKYRKIHITGGPGSGKSHIAKKLSHLYDIKSYDLDDLYWDLVKWNHKFNNDNLFRIRKFIADYEGKIVECKKNQNILRIIRSHLKSA